jgi:hypothetical protein
MGSDGPDLIYIYIIRIYTTPATTLDVVVATMALTKSFGFFFFFFFFFFFQKKKKLLREEVFSDIFPK